MHRILTLTIMTRGNPALPLFMATAAPVSSVLATAFDRLATMPGAHLGYRLARAGRDTRFAPQPMLEQGGS